MTEGAETLQVEPETTRILHPADRNHPGARSAQTHEIALGVA